MVMTSQCNSAGPSSGRVTGGNLYGGQTMSGNEREGDAPIYCSTPTLLFYAPLGGLRNYDQYFSDRQTITEQQKRRTCYKMSTLSVDDDSELVHWYSWFSCVSCPLVLKGFIAPPIC